MSASESQVHRPSRWLLLAEAPRAVGELAWRQAARPLLASAPRGDGHAVLVLPGMGADDRSTGTLRRFLRRLGYRVHGWELGTNAPTPAMTERLRERVERLRAQEPEPISLVGWSLGGIYARRIAQAAPESVRTVVTLGSPFRSVPGFESNTEPMARLLARISGHELSRRRPGVADLPLPVPSTAIISRTDGVVPWQACVNPRAARHETIEVIGSHFGLGHHPAVLAVVADRLAQAPDRWEPMRIPASWRPVLRRYTEDETAPAPGQGGPAVRR